MQKTPMEYDIAIIGAGIVGLSTAWQLLQKYPGKRLVVLDKAAHVAAHQTGHNSGVIHAGVYYAPGSLKAKFCKQGAAATKAFCQAHNIAYEECGKLLVATNKLELQRMDALFERCQNNDLEVHYLTQAQLHQREPNVVGKGALFVPSTGIVSYRALCEKLAELVAGLGGEIHLGTQVIGLQEDASGVSIDANRHPFYARYLVSCGGLMADRLTKMLGIKTDFQIVPFRGEYYRLSPHHNQIVNHLIYPIPDPDLPFLGVHLTRMIDGSVTVGPNAVQGWKREGYGRVNVSIKDISSMFSFPGYWRLIKDYWKIGLKETYNSWYRAGYLKQVKKYCPMVQLSDLEPYPAGIRAQAVMKDGKLMHDFLFVQSPRTLHVCNAPSPAATSAFPIGQYILNKLEQKMLES
ncbi:L-2-hydroxyglutarate oxidase LhgO [Marinomonas aquimarina]|uniref:L-2-hydroxyglutarate oxidase LhgO n=1 Tax=Marinomonas aquimarina TaxID=295068 RepID=A0A1A8THX7_9GAMM|nr:L-2-hydroxyglutarate oxidase [Marinomonas aquimarina]SBS33213.1 L-2-hydroxyglutarate oxidase LhgO [Marinomonas aquimarina]